MSGDRRARAEADKLLKAIAEIGFVLPGTLSERYLRCVHSGCHCHDDPPKLHGPYWYWTRKVNKKTVSRLLRPEQVADYQAWFDNRKRLRELTQKLEELSIELVDADVRSPRRQPVRSSGAEVV